VHHIRRAKRFVYIENQYFLGSCFMWAEGRDVGANHTIQAELTEKICAKIRAKERFVAYVTTPMYPEGVPSAGALYACAAVLSTGAARTRRR
jgi:phospholipase D1/2